MLDDLKPYAKAILGALGGLATWLATATADGGISTAELGGILVAVLTGAGVYGIKNTLPLPRRDPNTGQFVAGGDRGQSIGLVLLVILLLVIILLATGRL